MNTAIRGLVFSLSLLLVACGESTPPQADAPKIEAASTDPKYQNPLLNFPPVQFTEVLAECGQVLYSTATATDSKCRQDVKDRALKQGVTLTDANLDEPLVRDRYQFTTAKK